MVGPEGPRTPDKNLDGVDESRSDKVGPVVVNVCEW